MTTLSGAALSCWAKSGEDDLSPGLSLPQHMADSAAVAGQLWDSFLPSAFKRRIQRIMPAEGEARRLFVWLAAVHDIGKASPAFAVKVEAFADRMHSRGLTFGSIGRSTTAPPHSDVSQLIVERWLSETHGWQRDVAQTYAVIPGGHHGVTPSRRDLIGWSQQSWLVRGAADDVAWLSVQDELMGFAVTLAGVQEDLPTWSARPLPATVQVTLTGAVIVADWIASNADLFPYDQVAEPAERLERAWQKLALPAPWQPVEMGPDSEALFLSRFDFPTARRWRPVQEAALRTASDVDRPGLLIIEASMGEGKTEAALAVAELFARRAGCGGVFVALPTMATSNAMFDRVLAWLERLPDERGPGVVQSMFLAHGKSGLNDNFIGLMDSMAVRGIGDSQREAIPPEVVIAHEWLFGRKKGPLANFVVGTIDQVLFGALKSRHLVLRHLALTNKVVVLDEIHAADSYMSVYLRSILAWLGAYEVPTVLLSATLPPAQRLALLTAYASGTPTDIPATPSQHTGVRLSRRQAELAAAAAAPVCRFPQVADETAYPLVVATSGDGPLVCPVEASGRTTEVLLDALTDDDEALVELLSTLLRDGGCAAVIRNTVGRAQQTFRLLTSIFPGGVVLLHSRLLAVDRADREAALVRRLGPTAEATERRGPLVVVGTQVLEQSLDVDFDLMVTDLAPADLILQRMGRLHRHPRPVRAAPLDRARCVLVGVDNWTSAPPVPSDSAAAIYGNSALLRALAVLPVAGGTTGRIHLPDDIAPLVRSAYDPDLPPPAGWEDAMVDADEQLRRDVDDQENRAQTFCLKGVPREGRSILGWTDKSVGEVDDSADGQAQVRDAENSLEVVVVQRAGGEVRVLPWVTSIGGRVVPTETEPDRALARGLAGCTVRLPAQLSQPWHEGAVIGALERNAFPGWQASPWLKGQLVLVLDELLQTEIPQHADITYDSELGLIVDFHRKGAVA